ncbi:MAG: hypothetical protein IJS82_04735, partial [Paludibacteraceae bacterium]|nr:hypothetical protein [Paludibacteraceae bacterium]
ITNHQSPITTHQSQITNHQSPITNTNVYTLEKNMLVNAQIEGSKKAEIPIRIKATQRVTGLQTEHVQPLTPDQITRRVPRQIVEIY